MKNIIHKSSLFIVSALLTLTGCSDLEEEPVGLFSPESFFRGPSDVEISVIGAYNLMGHEAYYGRKITTTLMLRGDMCDIGNQATPARRLQINNFNVDSNNGMITAFWPRSYEIIGAANAAIGGAEELNLPDDQELQGYVAEARFIRAFTYFHLVRLFGEIPYIAEAIEDPAALNDIGKTAVPEVYAGIIEDLQFGIDNLPDTQGGVRSRATKATAASYLALVHLTLGNWQEALDNSKFVIDNAGRFGLGLAADYASNFNASLQDGTEEHLFFVDFSNITTGTDFMGPMTGTAEVLPNNDPSVNPSTEGWSVVVPSQAVYDAWNDDDYRKDVSFIDEAFNGDGEVVGPDRFALGFASNRPHIGKYFRNCGQASGDCSNSDNNYLGMRYAEVLLIAAEALNELGTGEGEARDYVNQIRARARNTDGTAMATFPPDLPTGLGQEQFRDSILEERRLELAFEFKRWYDIKRRDLGMEVFTGPNSLEPHPNFDPNRDYLLPLPQDELGRNPNLLPQNPGY